MVGRGVMESERGSSGESTSNGVRTKGLENDVLIDVGCGKMSDVCSTTIGRDSSKGSVVVVTWSPVVIRLPPIIIVVCKVGAAMKRTLFTFL